MTWQIFHTPRKGAPNPVYGTQGETQSSTVIAFLKDRNKSAAWWAGQKDFTCKEIKK